MTRQSFQRGYVSNAINKRNGTAFTIRYRIRRADGKYVHKAETLYGLSSKKVARSILEQRIREVSNRKVEAVEMTLKEFVEGIWKPYLDRKGVKPSTRLSYDSEVNRQILPALGGLRLADISPLHIEQLIQARKKSGVSPKTVRNMVILLQGIFSLAVDDDIVSRSPVRDKHKPSVQHQEKPTWKPEQVKEIIEAVPDRYRTLFMCAALTGARLGEILGLQWKHIDFEARVLRIKQSLWHGNIYSPKTQGSIRTVPLTNRLLHAFMEHHQKTVHNTPESFVFCKHGGAPLHPDVLRKDVLYPVLDRLHIPRSPRTAGFHTFRHSAASFINQKTGNMKLAQKLLGHASLSTTADIYTHTSAEDESKAVHAVDRAIYGDLFSIVLKNTSENKSAAVN